MSFSFIFTHLVFTSTKRVKIYIIEITLSQGSVPKKIVFEFFLLKITYDLQ